MVICVQYVNQCERMCTKLKIEYECYNYAIGGTRCLQQYQDSVVQLHQRTIEILSHSPFILNESILISTCFLISAAHNSTLSGTKKEVFFSIKKYINKKLLLQNNIFNKINKKNEHNRLKGKYNDFIYSLAIYRAGSI